jgi:hypothetical protein
MLTAIIFSIMALILRPLLHVVASAIVSASYHAEYRLKFPTEPYGIYMDQLSRGVIDDVPAECFDVLNKLEADMGAERAAQAKKTGKWCDIRDAIVQWETLWLKKRIYSALIIREYYHQKIFYDFSELSKHVKLKHLLYLPGFRSMLMKEYFSQGWDHDLSEYDLTKPTFEGNMIVFRPYVNPEISESDIAEALKHGIEGYVDVDHIKKFFPNTFSSLTRK